MQNKVVQVNEPKTKKAALNQAVYILAQISVHQKRKENIMKNKQNTLDKIARLNKVIEGLNEQIDKVDTTVSNWQETLDKLKLNHNLAESEILELQSELTRMKIEELRKNAEVLETGQTEKF